MLLLSLSAYGVTLGDDCDCGECKLGGTVEILPEEVAKVKGSYTGQYLAEILATNRKATPTKTPAKAPAKTPAKK